MSAHRKSRRSFIADAAGAATAAALGSATAAAPTPAPDGAAAPPRASMPGGTLRSTTGWTSGIPLGGLGTGSVEIRPDGTFAEWSIFNLGAWGGGQPEDRRAQAPRLGPEALLFHLYTRQGRDEPRLRRLSTRGGMTELYGQGWVRNVEEIAFDGRYPLGTLTYGDPTLPLEVTGTFFSPFVPHDARASGTPGFYAIFRLKNRSNRPVEATLAASMDNPLAWGLADRRLRNDISRATGATYLTMRTEAEAPGDHTVGSVGMSVSGGQHSWIAGEWASYMGSGEWVRTRNGVSAASWLRAFREDGRLPSTNGATSSARLLRLNDAELAGLTLEERRKTAAQMQEWPAFRYAKRRLSRVDGRLLNTADGLEAYLRECRDYLDKYAGTERTGQDWGSAALSSSVTVAPGDTVELVFTLGWHFPNHYSELGPDMGHRYEDWFRDAEAVNLHLQGTLGEMRRRVPAFSRALHDTSLGEAAAMSWSTQLATLVKSTWWVQDGRFGVWEGLGCCGFQTMDITYQGSHGLLALFPELQLGQMRMSAEKQREDGRIPHFFTPDLLHVDNGFDRVDMNPQFVLLVCRDYLWTGNREYLKEMWPRVRDAIKSISLLDSDGDGLPDTDTRRNTYDQWDFKGAPSYIGSLWIGALLAGIRMAKDLGDTESEALYRRVHGVAVRSFDTRIWNGEFYSLYVSGEGRDECCMTDQISGEGFTGLIGLGFSLPLSRIKAAYRAVMRHNFTHERGLLNASYPANRPASFPTYLNVQADGNWTGIEYTTAASLLDVGMAPEAMAVINAVHERYMRAGRPWNHTECGDHYYRAMASWAILNAATGFKPDVPRDTLTIAPPLASVRAPWASSTGWGVLNAGPMELRLACRAGRLSFRKLRLALKGAKFSARLSGSPLPVTTARDGDATALDFGKTVSIAAGRTLTVTTQENIP